MNKTSDTNKNIIAFGDIHGHSHAADAAIRLALQLDAKAIFLGDYVDRGPNPMQTLLSLIRAKAENPNWVFIKGNHEQMLLDLIQGIKTPNDMGELEDGNWFEYSQTEETFDQWRQMDVDTQLAIVEFLNSTRLYYDTKHTLFLHGVLRDTGERIDQKSEEELIWNYEPTPLWEDKKFVHGHLPVDKIEMYGYGIDINTGCGYDGFLTGLLMDGATGEPIRLYSISENGESITDEPFPYLEYWNYLG